MPNVFKDENHIDEIKGIYVPFWLFDANVDADVSYEATRVRTWGDRKNEYTETSYYQVDRGGTLAFKDIPVDGSSKMPDDIMESIEPFDLSQAVPFQTAYLAGYLAEKYDKPGTGGSDAHRPDCIGRGYTVFSKPIKTELDLIMQIRNKEVIGAAGEIYSKTTKDKLGKIKNVYSYSFWLYNNAGALWKKNKRKLKIHAERPIDPIDPIEIPYLSKIKRKH